MESEEKGFCHFQKITYRMDQDNRGRTAKRLLEEWGRSGSRSGRTHWLLVDDGSKVAKLVFTPKRRCIIRTHILYISLKFHHSQIMVKAVGHNELYILCYVQNYLYYEKRSLRKLSGGLSCL